MTAQQTTIEGLEKWQKPAETEALVPMRLIEMAVAQNADVDKLEKLLQLQIAWEKNEARKAFVVAMNAFKANPPQINKNKHVEFGNTKYDHATLDHVTDAITKSLSQHGISHRWDIEQKDGRICVTCVLTHEMGYSERTPLEALADTSGAKNSIQAIGSAVTYLQRYTLLSATGLAAKGTDNDGGAADVSGDMQEQLEWIANAKDLEELQRLFKNAYSKFGTNLPNQKLIVAAKDRRKAELR